MSSLTAGVPERLCGGEGGSRFDSNGEILLSLVIAFGGLEIGDSLDKVEDRDRFGVCTLDGALLKATSSLANCRASSDNSGAPDCTSLSNCGLDVEYRRLPFLRGRSFRKEPSGADCISVSDSMISSIFIYSVSFVVVNVLLSMKVV